MVTHIHVIGLGLIGGSMASGLNENENYKVTGYDSNHSRNDRALEWEIVDSIHPPSDLPDDVEGIILAVPVPQMPRIVDEIPEDGPRPEFITDVGSTKRWICNQMVDRLPSDVEFIGGHPMAGSEQSGLDASDPILFENAICVLTPTGESSEHLTDVKIIWDELGALVLEMSSEDHDRVVSYVSHLPHLSAAALLHAIDEVPNSRELALPLAAGGFRDTTRVALGDPELWKDIFQTNRKQILETISNFHDVINDVEDILETERWDELLDWFDQAREVRDEIPEKTKGLMGTLFELRLLAPDRPGILAEITSILGEESINITDIEVLRVREGEMGTIRLGFRRKEERKEAKEALERKAEGVQIIG